MALKPLGFAFICRAAFRDVFNPLQARNKFHAVSLLRQKKKKRKDEKEEKNKKWDQFSD